MIRYLSEIPQRTQSNDSPCIWIFSQAEEHLYFKAGNSLVALPYTQHSVHVIDF